MDDPDEIFNRIIKKTTGFYMEMNTVAEQTSDWLKNYKEELFEKIALAKANKSKVPILTKTPLRNRRPKRPALSSSTDEELTKTQSTISSGKPKREACKLAEQKINLQSQIKLNTKMRRPGKGDNALNDISNNSALLNIKSEKKSRSPGKEAAPETVSNPELEKVKKEMMPPPAAKPKRGRKKIKKEIDSSDTENEGATRVTRSKRTVNASTRSKTSTSKTRKDSDVILQEIPVPVLVIHDSDTEDDASQINLEAENKTDDKKQVSDTPVETDEDDLPLISVKPTKKTKKPREPKTKKTQKTKVTEEAKENAKNVPCIVVLETLTLNDAQAKSSSLNTTHVVEKDSIVSPLNSTHVVEKDSIISPLNSTHIVEKDAKISPLNTTHVVEKDARISPLNTTHVVEKDARISPLNTTHVIENPAFPLSVTNDCSVVLQKMIEPMPSSKKNTIADQKVVLVLKNSERQWKKANIPVPVDSLITDDDDSIVQATPEKKQPEPPRKGIKTKQMFSPYSNSPVRKRVAAFEKLVATDSVDAPTRVTRTKTRNMEKEKEQVTNYEPSRIPNKSKYTPTANNKLPSLIPQTDSKAYRQRAALNNNTSVLPTKSASAVKPTRNEVQLRREEEQKRRLEKEEEATRKRDALMNAKTEEQRKKREEKQLKAQKAREEKEREKEEKLRQILQEKEEEQQKKREYQARKWAEYEERKKNEEMAKMLKLREHEKQKQQEEKRRRLLAKKPPPLPTDDCEDSDSSSSTVTRKYQKPDWARSPQLNRTLAIWGCIDKIHIETLWQMEATTPDLREIFETVDERILRRNSSAVWRTPPRYSTLPKF